MLWFTDTTNTQPVLMLVFQLLHFVFKMQNWCNTLQAYCTRLWWCALSSNRRNTKLWQHMSSSLVIGLWHHCTSIYFIF